MAARSPTSKNRFVADSDYIAQKPVSGPAHAKVVDDQIYLMQQRCIVFSDQHIYMELKDLAMLGTYKTCWTTTIEIADFGGLATTVDTRLYIYTWATNTDSRWTVRLTNDTLATNDVVAITSAQTTPTWTDAGSDWTNSVNVNGTANAFTLAAKWDSGTAQDIFIGGISLVTV